MANNLRKREGRERERKRERDRQTDREREGERERERGREREGGRERERHTQNGIEVLKRFLEFRSGGGLNGVGVVVGA